MGDRGPAATSIQRGSSVFKFSRWEIGGQPQPWIQSGDGMPEFSRWEIGGQPQP